MKLSTLVLGLAAGVYAKSSTKQDVLDARFGSDWPFSGISTFAHLETDRCLVNPNTKYDIALIGVPFDTAVSYRPGARFGPRAIRAASMRQSSLRGFNARAGINPYKDWAKIIDCQDIPVTPVDNKLALHQMTEGFKELLSHDTASPTHGRVPRLVTLGGDHSIVLPHLRALKQIHGPITVIHFDAHLDTWLPSKYPSGWAEAEAGSGHFTHGTMFWMAHTEGLLAEDSCIHAGLRTRLSGTDYEDYADDSKQGFARISCDDIDTMGVEGIVDTIVKRVGDNPVYISLDIDVIDPGMAPGTGTPEVGGWTTREMIGLLRGLSGLNLVGADIVEVSPAFDNAEITALAGAQLAYEILTNMVLSRHDGETHVDPSHDEL
ncbi:Guanidinobutyrase [Wickerhamiella sorbophila]|uniref:Guanidinobutyrase n=1 Tax=Wickerhamiella sorbophila TaxID=45607 RepID=A0A2T0FLK3_9ASCO|nr:Guanidinobutyrase [Wickerhamiella sorbophila]PRT55847.1 Guanidinobutyrase [Wickerhamiella sorbophila]